MIIIGYKIFKENPPDFFSDDFSDKYSNKYSSKYSDKLGENKRDISKKSSTKKPSLPAVSPTNTATYPLVYESFIQNVQQIKQPLSSKNLYRGKSEAFFEGYLKKYFGDSISTDKALIINNIKNNKEYDMKDKFYLPDFIYQNNQENNHFFIDIEIDEPYSLPDGYPVHYQGVDNNRNVFFLRAGWHVIRFSEEQIIRQPAQCCRFLADFIQKKNQKQIHQNSPQNFSKTLENVPLLSLKTRHWTREEAIYMFSNKYRDSYL